MRNFIRWALPWAAAACVYAAPALAQAAARLDATTVTVQELYDDTGVTLCYNDQTFSFVRDSLPRDVDSVVRVHERKHREQAARFGNDCARWIAYYNTPVGMLESEAEAYMTDLCVAVSLGADPITVRQDYAEKIARYFGSGANQLSIREAMAKYDRCPLGANANLVPAP